MTRTITLAALLAFALVGCSDDSSSTDAAVQSDATKSDGGKDGSLADIPQTDISQADTVGTDTSTGDVGSDAPSGDAGLCAKTLTTQFNTKNQGLDGIMFDVTNTSVKDITITGIESHLLFGTHDIEIYSALGSHASIVANKSAWKLEGSAKGVVSKGGGVATPIPGSWSIRVASGLTVALYITASDDDPGDGFGVGYSPGTTFGAVAKKDANLEIKEGQGVKYPFTGTPSIPRVWDGTLKYSMPGACP